MLTLVTLAVAAVSILSLTLRQSTPMSEHHHGRYQHQPVPTTVVAVAAPASSVPHSVPLYRFRDGFDRHSPVLATAALTEG